MAVGNGGDGINIRNVRIGVSQGLNINGLGVGLDRLFHFCQIVDIHKAGGNAPLGQGVGQQIAGAAVDGFLGHNVLSLTGQGLDGIGDGGGTGGHGQGGSASLQGGDPLFKDLLGGVGEPPVDVAGLAQAEPVRRILAAGEHIGGGGINGHCPGITGRIGLLLAHVQLHGFKTVSAHRGFLFSVKCDFF